MGYGKPDLYYNPEEFGLTPIGEIDWLGDSYEFNLTVVWVDAEGKYYWATHGGCSCVSPFEDFNSLEDENVNRGNKWDVIGSLTEQAKEVSFYRSDQEERINNEITALIERIVLR